MTINSLKELNKLMILCRKQGIRSIKVDNIEFHIDDVTPPSTHYVTPEPRITTNFSGVVGPETKILTANSLTEEQLLYYSTGEGVEQ